ncbi:MAG: hypothetical protein KKD44_09520 [Proteobacteria bacterium]|nr:hypothetical protein [Pseudomonadota bacterium]
MKKIEEFSDEQIVIVNNAIEMAEDIVSEFYKMSSSQWLRNRYDVLTLSQLSKSEIVFGPFAQIVRYLGKRNKSQLGSGDFDFYRICLQDHSIIQALRENFSLRLDPFVLYIIAHELIHIIRFGKFIQFFDASPDERALEETIVHQSTVDILKKINISGMKEVFKFYGC